MSKQQDTTTFTGLPLEEMTRAQLVLEYQADMIKLFGLRNGFRDNCRTFGMGYACNLGLEKIGLRLSRKKSVESEISDYSEQVVQDRKILREKGGLRDNDSRSYNPYRTRTIDNVLAMFERLNERTDRHAKKDAIRFIKEHNENLAEAQRTLIVEEQDDGIRKKLSKIKNFAIRYKKIVLPIAAALALGGIGGGTSYGIISHNNKNRPAVMVPAELVRTDHIGVNAALAVNNSAMQGNALLNNYNADALSVKELIIQNSNLISEVNNTRGKTAAALTYYSFIRDPLVLVNSGGDLISSAWNHSSNESGHYYQTCSTDTKGNTSCTQHYVCDYIDHTWTFNPSRAAQGIKTYLEGSTTLNSDRSKHPKTVNISFLDKLMKDNLLKEGEKDLTPEQKEERIKQLTDWLKSVTIKGNNTVVADISYLIGASQGGELSWLNDNYTNTRLFPLISKDRDNSCGSGVAPKGYNVSQRFDSKTDRTMQHYANVISRTSGSVELLKKYKSKLLEINTELKRGASANDVEDQYDELGEIAIELHKKFNPKSSYKSLSKGWRTAIPIMLLCGLGSLGGIGGYFLLKKYEDKKYRSRMRRYSIYS